MRTGNSVSWDKGGQEVENYVLFSVMKNGYLGN